MRFYFIEPEVAGGWGRNTVFDRKPGAPTIVLRLDYEFRGWLGDELLESTPCFIVSERVAVEIEQAGLSGASVDQVEISMSERFRDLYPRLQLPKFLWLRVVGFAGTDDFGIACDKRLVVSERALAVLRQAEISHAVITPFTSASRE